MSGVRRVKEEELIEGEGNTAKEAEVALMKLKSEGELAVMN